MHKKGMSVPQPVEYRVTADNTNRYGFYYELKPDREAPPVRGEADTDTLKPLFILLQFS